MLTPADLCGNGIKCKEIPIDPINETIVAFINSQKEASQYDFKQEWQKSGKDGDLLHDILCLANNEDNEDTYLIIGVTDDYEVVGVKELKKSNDKITVRDVVENCDYSTATFYRHFKDKYDLIAWDYSRDIERIIDQVGKNQASWQQALSDAAAYYESHKGYLQNLLLHNFWRMGTRDFSHERKCAIPPFFEHTFAFLLFCVIIILRRQRTDAAGTDHQYLF